ncbi:unannotated protein [freshwater metagenome]|uniref:Unannotated protein n=1 Tax=freshwater metagenome TaxID=449393 RepID=A0A6J7Q6G6_9ZZZZ
MMLRVSSVELSSITTNASGWRVWPRMLFRVASIHRAELLVTRSAATGSLATVMTCSLAHRIVGPRAR